MRDRVLIVLPESHAFPREEEARILARALKSAESESRVTLFLESRRHESGPEASADEDAIPILTHGVGSGLIDKVYFPVAFLQLTSEFCRFSAVNGNSALPRALEITREALDKTRLFYEIHGRTPPTDRILAIQQMMLSEINHAAAPLLGKIEFTMPELAKALSEVPKTISGKIPKGLSAIMMPVLSKVTPGDVESLNRFRGELERGLKVQTPRLEQKFLTQLRSCIFHDDAIGAFRNADALMTSVRQVREYTLPFFILKQSFDIGVLSCCLNHAAIKTLEQALQKAGIKMVVDLNGMFRSTRARDS
jgi:hypothetical protein